MAKYENGGVIHFNGTRYDFNEPHNASSLNYTQERTITMENEGQLEVATADNQGLALFYGQFDFTTTITYNNCFINLISGMEFRFIDLIV